MLQDLMPPMAVHTFWPLNTKGQTLLTAALSKRMLQVLPMHVHEPSARRSRWYVRAAALTLDAAIPVRIIRVALESVGVSRRVYASAQ